MIPIFDKNTNLVGWLNNDLTNIFDTNMTWVAYITNNDSIWSVGKKSWIGNLFGTNIRDTNGKTIYWNTKTTVSNSLRPLKPLSPLRPLTPLKPLKPLTPLRPLKPLTPLGGWSELEWIQFINS